MRIELDAKAEPKLVCVLVTVMRSLGGTLPENYQVVVKASSSTTIPLTVQYVSHRVIGKTEGPTH